MLTANVQCRDKNTHTHKHTHACARTYASKGTNGTEVMADACEGLKDALGPNGTAVFGYNQG